MDSVDTPSTLKQVLREKLADSLASPLAEVAAQPAYEWLLTEPD